MAASPELKEMAHRDETSVKFKRKSVGIFGSYKVLIYIALYYAISLALSLFNTQVLGKTRMNFPYPLFAALIYDLVQFSFAASIMATMAAFDKNTAVPIKAYKDLGSRKFIRVILPCALAAGLDIALSNCSLKHVSLSFYTMVKSSAPMFILIFAFVFRLEKFTWQLAAIIGVIGVGTGLTVYNPTNFDILGFCLVFSAAVMSGIRWALTQLIIESKEVDDKTKSSDGPLSAILFLTPPIGVTIAILCATFEGFSSVFSTLFSSFESTLQTTAICITGGVLTFSLILTEYKVVETSSVLTLSISGIVKEILMIAVSQVVFKDTLLPINYAGLIISIIGIICYNWYKLSCHKKTGLNTMMGADMYLAVPNCDQDEMFLNPFIDDDDFSTEIPSGSASYIELESGRKDEIYASHLSKSKSWIRDRGSNDNIDPETYFKTLKNQWSSLPSLDHYPSIAPSAEPNV